MTGFRLMNEWQRGFPLAPRPFAEIAAHCGMSEEEVIGSYRALKARGLIDRIGPVFRPNTVGASTLAALAVPPADLERVAALVSARPEVNHNYAREHRWNLWFVVAAQSAARVEAAVRDIEAQTGRRALRCPLLEEYHIDLGFDLADGSAPREARAVPAPALGACERRLVGALARGIPLVPRPFAQLARTTGMDEAAVLATLERWLASGVVRRIGAVVRHRPLGFRAIAMAVWDVPDALVADIGGRVAADPAVTLCYRRARQPGWPYNLYLMVHGRERPRVRAQLARIAQSHGLERFSGEVLFSTRCFAQRGAHYVAQAAHG